MREYIFKTIAELKSEGIDTRTGSLQAIPWIHGRTIIMNDKHAEKCERRGYFEVSRAAQHDNPIVIRDTELGVYFKWNKLRPNETDLEF